jgi:20S proteasome alpha/beta subunit
LANSATIIAVLRYPGGAIIAADSQTSDPIAGVRWQTTKLTELGKLPCVVGFSGATGRAQQCHQAFKDKPFEATSFKKSETLRTYFSKSVTPVFQQIITANPKIPDRLWTVTLWGLIAAWAENDSQILEIEPNGVLCFHPSFHAIGSGAPTAYAVYRTLGGTRLSSVDERRAIMAMLRILRTAINVDFVGVSEPIDVWVISKESARQLSPDELAAHLQAAKEWQQDEQERFYSGEV